MIPNDTNGSGRLDGMAALLAVNAGAPNESPVAVVYTPPRNKIASTLYIDYATMTDSGGANASAAVIINVVTPVAAPHITKVSVGGGKVVTVAWSWSGTAPLQEFRLERKVNTKTGVWGQVGRAIGPSLRSITDSPGKGKWSYRMFALSSAVTSASSNVVNTTVN